MAIPCPRCGRQYDNTLFEFGRTIHCACGSRVGREVRIELGRGGAERRFMVDAMLGRLAHWLRILGFDAAYEAHIEDGELVRRAVTEGRLILTRDRALPDEWRVAGVHLVRAEKTLDQLREVVARFELRGASRLFTRCSRCNVPLVDASLEEVRDRVPPRIASTRRVFRRCPGCGRVYWDGSHTERMRRVVAQVLAAA